MATATATEKLAKNTPEARAALMARLRARGYLDAREDGGRVAAEVDESRRDWDPGLMRRVWPEWPTVVTGPDLEFHSVEPR